MIAFIQSELHFSEAYMACDAYNKYNLKSRLIRHRERIAGHLSLAQLFRAVLRVPIRETERDTCNRSSREIEMTAVCHTHVEAADRRYCLIMIILPHRNRSMSTLV